MDTSEEESSPICSSIAEDILVDILSRIPVKTLMRFKCVCKPLRFLIEKDQNFINLHLTHSKALPQLFIVIQRKMSQTNSETYFLTADFFENRRLAKTATIHTIRKFSPWDLGEISKPIDGLMCCRKGDAVRVYNVSTREITPWIISPLPMNGIYNRGIQFGFDPATKKHKVISILFGTNSDKNSCLVLTVGENIWRTMDDKLPEFSKIDDSIHVNGSIYWIDEDFYYYKVEKFHYIMVLDVGSEKFRMIPIPSFIINQSRDESPCYGPAIKFVEVNGCVGIIDRINDSIVKLWILDDGYKTGRNDKWMEETIKLPFSWGGLSRVDFHTGIRDHILLEVYKKHNKIDSVSYHFYNWKKKTFQRFDIHGIPSSVKRSKPFIFMPISESLLPVQERQPPSHSSELHEELSCYIP